MSVRGAASRLLADDHASVLIVPGLWGAHDAVAAARETPGVRTVLTVLGGAGRGRAMGDLVVALRAHDPRVTSADYARAAWDALASDGTVVVVHRPGRVDGATAEALDRAARSRTHLILVVAAHMGDMERRTVRAIAAGRMRWMIVEPLAPAQLVRRLEERTGGPIPSVVLGRILALSGGHVALIDLLLEIAGETGVLSYDEGLPLWQWDEEALRRGAATRLPALLGGLGGAYARVVTVTGLAGIVRPAHLTQMFSTGLVSSLRSAQILTTHTDPHVTYPLIRLGAELLEWAVLDTAGRGGDVAGWYEYSEAVDVARTRGLARVALEAWRARIERSTAPAEAAAHAHLALDHGWVGAAESILDAARSEDADEPLRLRLAVVRARMLWGRGDFDAALRLLGENRDELWPRDEAIPRPGRDAARLVLHIAVFHRARAFDLLSGEGDGVDRDTWPASVPEALRTARRAGLEVLPDLIDALMRDDVEGAQLLLQTRGRGADLVEESVSRLWLGCWAGMRAAHDFGRQVLSGLLDDLEREGGEPFLLESARAGLLIISMDVGWTTDDLRVNAREWDLGRRWHPGAHAVDQVIRSIALMQDDRMRSGLHAARSAEHAAGALDTFGMRASALAMTAATASFLPLDSDREREVRAREAFDRLDLYDSFHHLRLLARGLCLVGAGPTAAEVATRQVELSAVARRAGEHAQGQQLLLLGVLGLDAEAIRRVRALKTYSGRAGMIRMLGEALDPDRPDPDDMGDEMHALEIAEAFGQAGVRYYSHLVLYARWNRETADGGRASQRLIRMLIRAAARADEWSWVLERTAPELRLSDREATVVQSLRDGAATGTIALDLGLSPRTVEGIVSRLLGRFGVPNRLELVRLIGEYAQQRVPGRPR
jgi:DNA-binding CsgD family transcriptional regulator